MKIRKNTLKKIIAEATRLTENPNAPGVPDYYAGKGAGGIGMDDIWTNMGTDFSLFDEVAEDLELGGSLLDPADLRALPDMLEKVYNGTLPYTGQVEFSID